MDRQILNFTVNEQILVCENPIKISTNKVNYIQNHFDLGENWDGFDSVRAVWFNDFNCISTVLDSLGNCVVPFEVMKRKGNVKVNLVGSISEDDVLTDRLTSYPVVAVIVDCNAQITGANTSPITPSEYEQFVAAVHEDAERAEAGATASEQSAQNAHASEQNASQSATSAHNDKIAIEQAIAEVIQRIEDFEQVQVVVNTLPPSSQATSDFTDGVLTLGIPQGVKGDTGNGIQSIRKTGTSGLVDTYTITYTDGQTTTFTVTNGAKGDTGNGIATIEKTSTVGLVDTYTITYTDGNTTTFTVTNGEKGDKGDTGEVSLNELEDATVVQTLSDSEPYNYRRTNNGNGAGHREYDEIVGASVGWNQLSPIITDYGAYLGTKSVSDNVLTFTATASTSSGAQVYKSTGTPLPASHKYLSLVQIRPSKAVEIKLSYYGSTVRSVPSKVMTANVWNLYSGITETATNTAQLTFYTNVNSALSEGDTVKYKDFMVTDLTSFNSTIADYVYTLEQSTAGSGVTWLKTHFPRLFDNGYQPFDSGSIKSVSGLTAHEMVGRNLLNKDALTYNDGYALDANGNVITNANLGYVGAEIPVLGTTYTISGTFVAGSGTTARVYYFDANKDFIDRSGTFYNAGFTFTPPQNCRYIGFQYQNGSIQKDTLQLELGSTATSYEPHESHTYPLDSSVTLRGKYVLDNGQLKAVGDVWKSSGEIERSWVELTLDGSDDENWIKRDFSSTGTMDFFHYQVGALNSAVENAIVCDKYPTTVVRASNTNIGIDLVNSSSYSGAFVTFRPSGADDMTIAQLRTLLSQNPITVVYEKTTATTETATPYTNPQWCDSHGTEEYIGSELPCGHSTDYPMSLVDTMPTSNGTFEPRITVTNGVRTVTWVSV